MEVGGTLIYKPNTGEVKRAYNAKLFEQNILIYKIGH